MIGTGGIAPKIKTTHTVALYSPDDGRVVHLHRVVTFEGGKSIGPDDAQREAHEIARRHGRDLGKLRTLLVAGDLPAQGGGLRVDLASQKLVSDKPPARPIRHR